MPKVYQHGDKYRITYRVPGFDRIFNESFDTKEEADLRLAEIQLQRVQGRLLPPQNLLDPERDRALLRETMTVSRLMQEYINLYGVNHWSESTLSLNLHRINDYIIPYIGDVPIKTLTTHRLEEFYRYLLTMPAVKMKGRENEDRTISHSVVEKVHSILRGALNQAIRWDYFRGANPAMAVELPRYKKNKRDAWSDQEAKYALELCEDAALKLCMLLALGCSMRIGEILGLIWDCVHIEPERVASNQAFLYINKELRRCEKASLELLRQHGRNDVFFEFPDWKQTGCSTVLVLKTPKTESSVRSVYLPDTLVSALLQTWNEQQRLKAELGGAYQDFGLVVAQELGRPYEERQIADKMKQFIGAHGLRPVVFHSLRHSSTSIKLKLSGGDIKAVQGDTGHAQSNMVTDVYSHIMDEDRRHLAQTMNDIFFNAPAPISAPISTGNPAVQQAIEMLQQSPELAETMLKMSQLLGVCTTQ